ncbi:MAG: hypothetical protein M5U09_22595 [Gammaproteobacteria bacterium]|nr:hypothetical protein [Gammaproteobacteria bacterium]
MNTPLALTMIAPATTAAPGTSPQNSQPTAAANTSATYSSGAEEAGVGVAKRAGHQELLETGDEADGHHQRDIRGRGPATGRMPPAMPG